MHYYWKLYILTKTKNTLFDSFALRALSDYREKSGCNCTFTIFFTIIIHIFHILKLSKRKTSLTLKKLLLFTTIWMEYTIWIENVFYVFLGCTDKPKAVCVHLARNGCACINRACLMATDKCSLSMQ
jgi:hypothetical protein